MGEAVAGSAVIVLVAAGFLSRHLGIPRAGDGPWVRPEGSGAGAGGRGDHERDPCGGEPDCPEHPVPVLRGGDATLTPVSALGALLTMALGTLFL